MTRRRRAILFILPAIPAVIWTWLALFFAFAFEQHGSLHVAGSGQVDFVKVGGMALLHFGLPYGLLLGFVLIIHGYFNSFKSAGPTADWED